MTSRWVFVADVGGRAGYHVGDEAMLDANVSLFRRLIPSLEATVVSEDPAFTANAYGVNAVPPLGFSALKHADDRERDDRLASLLACAADDDAPEAIRVLQRADGLVISGGGNLSSSWPHHIYERAALVDVARRRGIPVVILGQTLGPYLSDRHNALVSQILHSAIWIGIREAHSYSLALHMGVPRDRLSYQIDDAITLPSEALDEAALPSKSHPRIAVTIHPVVDPGSADDMLDCLASVLGELADATGARLEFIPHQDVPSDQQGWSDRAMGEALASRLAARHNMLVRDIVSARQTRWLTSQADLVISTRYHPIVFGLASCVPCLGIATSQYTRVKLEGALIHASRTTDVCDISEVESGILVKKAMSLWKDRAVLRERLRSRVADWRDGEERRSRTLAEVLRTGSAAAHTGQSSFDDARLVRHLAEALYCETDDRVRVEEKWVANMTVIQAHMEALERSRQQAINYAESLAEREHARSQSLTTITNDKAREVRASTEPGDGRSLPEQQSSVLTERQWKDFDRHGFMYLGEVLGADEIDALTRRADDLALSRLTNPAVQMQLDTGGAYDELPSAVRRFQEGTLRYRKIQGLETDDLFARLIQKPIFREVCAHMYGRHTGVSIFRAMIMNKPAEQGTYLPWHQDGGYVWQLDRDPLVTIWVALDSATRANGCMEAVVGSHRLGLLSQFGSTVSDENVALHCLPERTQALEVPAGHAIFIHNWLIHRSGINPTCGPRRAFTMCCMDGRTRNIATGAPFPVIYGVPDDPHPYVLEMRREQAALRETAVEAERYAISLQDEGRALRKTADEATIYARSLEQELATLRQMRADAERYARSLEAELKERRV